MTFLANLFPRVVNLSVVASIVILFVLTARLFLRRVPKVFSYALWGIVLVRLLIPVSIPSPVSVVPETPAVDQYQINQALPELEFETPSDRQENNQSIQNADQNNGVVVQVSRRVEPVYYLTIVWLVGMALMTLYSILSYRQIRKKVEISVPLRDNIYLADDIQSPFVIGMIRPKIYLPDNLGQREQEYIILHEQHHIRRFDHWMKALAFLALTIHWFNPLVWVAFVLSSKDMEMSCDEAVIRKAGEGIRADYSASLLTLATGRRIIAGTPLAFGEGDTKGRIRNLANWKHPAFWVILIVVLLCIVLAVCLLTNPLEDNGNNDGVTWYYGTVVDSAMSVVNEGDRDGRSYITIQCDDGEERLFWLAKGCEKPEDLLGKYVMVRATTESGTGLSIVTSIQLSDPAISDSLDEAIHQAILAHHSGKYLEGQCQTGHFKQLSSEEDGAITESGVKYVNEITVYGIVLYQEFDLKEGILEDTSGACCPTVLTFTVSEDGKLTLKEYWEPRDGTYYPTDLKAKFKGRPFPDVQQYRVEQQLNLYAQAMEYFGVGTDVVIHTILQDIVESARWQPIFKDRVSMEVVGNETNMAMLRAYSTDTLRYCFNEFLKGGQTDTKGDLMASVCQNLMEYVGEDLHTDWSDVNSSSGQDWFLAFTSHALSLINLEGLSLDEIRTMYPASYLYLEMTGALSGAPVWGITMQAENVTPIGLTLVVSQSGVSTTGAFMSGQPYSLQVYENGQWKALPTLLDNWAWTMEGWMIPMNDTVRWNVNWSWLYGELPPGQYRIAKSISEWKAPGDTTEATFYAEFTIE